MPERAARSSSACNVIANGDRGAPRGGRRMHFHVVDVQRLARERPDEVRGAAIAYGLVIDILVFVIHASARFRLVERASSHDQLQALGEL